MKIRIGAVLLVALLVAADTPDEAVKKEKEKFKGVWVVQSFEAGGKSLDQLKGMTYEFDGDKLVLKHPKQKEAVVGSYKLDPTKDPKELDLITPRADGAKSTTRSIYILDGDELKICCGANIVTTDSKGKMTEKTGERPKKMDDKSGGFIILKREKK